MATPTGRPRLQPVVRFPDEIPPQRGRPGQFTHEGRIVAGPRPPDGEGGVIAPVVDALESSHSSPAFIDRTYQVLSARVVLPVGQIQSTRTSSASTPSQSTNWAGVRKIHCGWPWWSGPDRLEPEGFAVDQEHGRLGVADRAHAADRITGRRPTKSASALPTSPASAATFAPSTRLSPLVITTTAASSLRRRNTIDFAILRDRATQRRSRLRCRTRQSASIVTSPL